MRVALIAPPWMEVPPLRWGGTEFVVAELAKGLTKRGHDVTVFACAGSELGSIEVVNPLVVPDPSDCPPDFQSDWVRRSMELIREADVPFDLVHDHTDPGAYMHGGGLPVVSTMHWEVSSDYPGYVDKLKAAADGGNITLVAISRRQGKQAEAVGIRKYSVIHHGVPVEEFTVGKGVGDEHGKFLLYVGRIVEAKGVHWAVQAVQKANLRLKVVGPLDPSDAAFFAKEVEPYCRGSVQYLGNMSRLEVRKMMQDASAFVLPTKWHEPFGLVYIEALASGLPVVTTRKGAAPEIVTSSTGVFVDDPGALDVLAAAMVEASGLDRGACRHRAAKAFSTDRMVADHLVLYASLTKSLRQESQGLAPDLGTVGSH